MKFTVVRQHLGDRMYMPGEEREMPEADAKSLLVNGVLERSATKAAQKVENKAAPKSRNKGG